METSLWSYRADTHISIPSHIKTRGKTRSHPAPHIKRIRIGGCPRNVNQHAVIISGIALILEPACPNKIVCAGRLNMEAHTGSSGPNPNMLCSKPPSDSQSQQSDKVSLSFHTASLFMTKVRKKITLSRGASGA